MRHRWLIGILAVAVVVRLGLVNLATARTAQTPDSAGYWRLADRLLSEGRFARDDRAEIFRTPGYPAFLAAALTTAGDRALSEPWKVAAAIQALADVLLVGVVFALGSLLASARTGLAAAALQAVTPVVVASCCRILSDSPYALLFTVAVLLMVGYLRTRQTWALLASGGVLGLACYVRPVGLVMALVFAGAALVRGRPLRRVAAFAGVFAAVVAPWVVRNAARADYPGFSTFATDSMYTFAAAEVVAQHEGLDGQAARQRLRSEDADYVRTHRPTPGAAARRRAGRALEIIGEHPWTYAKLHAAGSAGFWLPGATDVLEVAGLTAGGRNTLEVLRREGLWAAGRHYFAGRGGLAALAGGMALILLVEYFGVAACVAGGLRRAPAEAWFLAAVVIVSALLPGPFGLPRYRVPVAPILNVAAAAGLLAVIGRLRRAGGRRGPSQ
jgi:4-amino-4-deoxy-L-arabinose transferase-like glycosyltransferase